MIVAEEVGEGRGMEREKEAVAPDAAREGARTNAERGATEYTLEVVGVKEDRGADELKDCCAT